MALAPYEARGAEADPAADLAFGSTIYVVKPAEVGLVVRDVSQADDSANLVCNAQVKIRSRYNGCVVEGTTDEAGSVHFDISELAEEDGMKEPVPHYAFNATIEVSAPGYRSFRTGLYRVEGGTALAIPTQPKQPGLPYPVSTSFDEWDVLYSDGDASTFVSATGNDTTHTIGLALDDVPADANVTAGIFCDGMRVAKTTVRAAADGTAQIELKDDFLRAGSDVALPTGDDHDFTMRYIVGGTTYEVPIKLSVCAAPPEAQTSQVKKDLELVPFNDATMYLGLDVPESWPLIGGTKIKFWRPSFFADFCYDPFGFILVKFSTPEFGYKNDFGKTDNNGWQVCSRKWPQEQFKSSWNDITASAKAADAAFGASGAINQIDFAHKFSFTAQLEFVAAAMWEFSEKESRGHARATARIGANYSFTENFWAGPFPILIRFSVGLSGQVSAMMGYVSPSVWKFSQYRWDYTSTGFEVSFAFAPTLSVGIGINGLASVSLKGCFSLTYSLFTGPMPEGFENYPDPHIRLAGKACATVEGEVLWFTRSWKIWNDDWPDWYNNWDKMKDKDKLQAGGGFTSELEGKGLAEALNEASIITTDDLDSVAEFETSGLAGMNPQEKVLDGYTLFERTPEGDKPVAQLYMGQEEATLFASDAGAELEGAALGAAAAAPPDHTDGEGIVVEGQAVGAIDGEPSFILRQANDQVSTFVAAAPDARPVGEHDYVEIPDEAPGVLRLGLEQGFRPTADIRLADNILLTSRTKLFTVADTDYIARIGVARVNGQARTRVICSEVNGKDRRLLDFVSAYGRDDCFDYDFDIASTTVDGREIVNMVVISGTRDQGDATSFASAAARTFFSFVSCSDWRSGAGFTGMTILADAVDAIGDRGRHYPCRNYSCPRLVQIRDTKDGVEYGQASVAFLERASLFEDTIMSSDPDLTKAGVGFVFFADGDDSINVSSMDPMRSCVMNQICDPSITEIALSGRADGHQLLELKGSEKTHYLLLETDPCWYIIGGRALPWLHSVTVLNLGAYEDKVSRLIPMESGSYFLTCVDGMLKRLDVTPGGEGQEPTLQFSDFGGDELNMNDFGVLEGGDVLYWPAMREDGGYVFDGASDGGPTLREGEEGALNLIMAARVRDGRLSKAFALCEVSHEIHRIRHYGNSEDHMSFISSNTVDLDAGKGELWYTAVPWVRCANLLGSAPYDTVCAAGVGLPFFVTLRNDGNCYLSGVELTVAEVGGAAVGTIRLDFGEGNLVASEWNPANEDGGMDNVESDYALAPGMTSRYLVSGFTVPKDWEGEKDVEVFVTAVYGKTVKGLFAQAEDHSIEYLPDTRSKLTLSLGKSEMDVREQDSFGPADVVVAGSGNGGKGGKGGKGGSGSGGKGGSGSGNSGGSSSGGKGGSGKGGSSSGGSGSGSSSSGFRSSGANGSGASGNGGSSSANSTQTASTGGSAAGSRDAMDAYKRGSMPKTGDPANLTAAAAVAIGGAASIAAAKALADKSQDEG